MRKWELRAERDWYREALSAIYLETWNNGRAEPLTAVDYALEALELPRKLRERPRTGE